jgi:hypothetical protein
MDKKLNDLLVKKIHENISKDIKVVEYLMEILNISKESAYRRMRSEIPFSFDEISLLALDLNFSIDEIIGSSEENRIFFDLKENNPLKPEESFLKMFEEYYKYTDLVTKSSKGEIVVSANRLSLFSLIAHDSLFKLFYYRWISQTNNAPITTPFSEVVIPAEILAVKEKFKPLRQKLPSITFIIDRNIFLSIVREIQYYYSRKLISEGDIIVLKQELIKLVNEMEFLMQKGTNECGSTYNFYLSLLDIETNTAWASDNTYEGSLFWICSVNSVVLYSDKINKMHKKWLETQKKSSVLITLSNEILQVNFIDKQREYIENIMQDLSYYK